MYPNAGLELAKIKQQELIDSARRAKYMEPLGAATVRASIRLFKSISHRIRHNG